MSSKNLRLAVLISVASGVLGVAEQRALAAVTFNTDTVIASNASSPSTSFFAGVKLGVYTVGGADVLWNTNPNGAEQAIYTDVGNVLTNTILVNNETVPPSAGHSWAFDLMGISRVGGAVSAGIATEVNSSTELPTKYTRTGPGAWSASSPGVTAQRGYATGAYQVNPITGLGSFTFSDSTGSNPFNFINETSPGVWQTNVIQASASTFSHSDMVYDAAGKAYVSAILPGHSSDLAIAVSPAGNTPPALTNTSIDPAHHISYSSIAVDAAGDVHLITAFNATENYWLSTDHGVTFSFVSSPIAGSTPGGDIQLAVSPTGEVAALLYDASSHLVLETSLNNGATWDLTPLSSVVQEAAVSFDSSGNLYVAYYDPTDSSLHLKTTVSVIPEPASAAALVGLLAMTAMKRRRAKAV